MSERSTGEAGRWMAQAADDLDTARLLAHHGRNALACFVAQQAAEKALKGLLYAAGAEVVLGHSVAMLCGDVAAIHPDLASRCGEWASLDQHYIPTRYPDALPGGIPADVYTADQAAAAVELAADVLGAVSERLPP